MNVLRSGGGKRAAPEYPVTRRVRLEGMTIMTGEAPFTAVGTRGGQPMPSPSFPKGPSSLRNRHSTACVVWRPSNRRLLGGMAGSWTCVSELRAGTGGVWCQPAQIEDAARGPACAE